MEHRRLLLRLCQVLPAYRDDAEEGGRRGPRAELGDRVDQLVLLRRSQRSSCGLQHGARCGLDPVG